MKPYGFDETTAEQTPLAETTHTTLPTDHSHTHYNFAGASGKFSYLLTKGLLCVTVLLVGTLTSAGTIMAGFRGETLTEQVTQPKTPNQGQQDSSANSSDELIVKFRESAPHHVRHELHASLGVVKTGEIPSLHLHKVKLESGSPAGKVMREYRKNAQVVYAEPNFAVRIQQTPNDSSFSGQWGLRKISAEAAWDSSTGSNQVVVGVLDTGIDYNHPDLAMNVWHRPTEVADGYSDGNGTAYAGIVYGINTLSGTSEPMDDNGHGSHVAGIIGAVGNNGLGVSGVNWRVMLLPCKFLDSSGAGYLFDALVCLDFIKEMKQRGANIIATNNSWTIAGTYESQSLSDAITAQRTAGILFIAAAGNDAADRDSSAEIQTVVESSNMINVAATDIADEKAAYSNFGSRTVQVGAPGHSVYSTVTGGNYDIMSGTSMAAPHVAGLAALLKAQDMSRDWIAIKNRILSTGDSLQALQGITVTGRRINAHAAAACSSGQNSRPLLSVLQFPEAPVADTAYPLAALSINCDSPSGFSDNSEISVAVSTGGSVTLRDEDRDGVFTGTWNPTAGQLTGEARLTFTSPAGSQTVAIPPVHGDGFFVSPVDISNQSYLFLRHGEYGSVALTASGGAPPYQWSSLTDLEPFGLSLSADGLLSGTPNYAVSIDARLQVTDSIAMTDTGYVRIIITAGAVDGWPKLLEQRTGSDIQALSSNPVFADIDGDTGEELIVPDLNALTVFHGDGTRQRQTFAGAVATPAIADLDQDGALEIILSVAATSEPPSLHLLDADLAEHPGFPVPLHASAGSAGTPVVADLDNDGSLEVIVVCRPAGTDPDENAAPDDLVVLDHQGSILAGWPRSFGSAYTTNTEHLPAVGDIDLDGLLEIVFPANDGYMRILRVGSPLPVRQWSFNFYSSNYPYSSPVLVDINNDGRLEIAIQVQIWGNNVLMRVFTDSGAQIWSGLSGSMTTGAMDGLIAGDFDGNGFPEIIYGVSGLSNDATRIVEFSGGSPISDRTFNYGLTGNPVSADMNGDGAGEIVMASTDGILNQSHLVTLNSSGSTMPPGMSLPAVDRNNFSPALGDFFNDDRMETVVKSADGIMMMALPGSAAVQHHAAWPVYRHDLQHTGRVPVPVITLSFRTYVFPDTMVGTAGPECNATLTNSGTAELTLNALTMTGGDAHMFTLASGNCGPLPKVLLLGQSCTVSVAFAPASAGVKSASLVIGTGASEMQEVTISFSGTGQSPYRTLTVAFPGNGQGSVTAYRQTADPENPTVYAGSCSTGCSLQLDANATVTLQAMAGENSFFASWSGCDSSTGTSCTLALTSERTAQVMFTIRMLNVTAVVTAGSGTVSPEEAVVTYGSGITCNITPAPGSYIRTVHDNGILVSAQFDASLNRYFYTIREVKTDRSLHVTFAADTVPKVAHMKHGRGMHTATLMTDGKVLLTGGTGSGLGTAELYDPATGNFNSTGDMAFHRYAHVANLLENGEVLITGGHSYASGTIQATAERYSPATGQFTLTGLMQYPRYMHSATRLENGTVLIAGGLQKFSDLDPDAVQASAELYDPVTQSFRATGSMSVPRYMHHALLLADGRVLVTGGKSVTNGSGVTLASAEIYDPATGSFAPAGSMSSPQSWHSGVLLPDGTALIGTAERYNPASGVFSPVAAVPPVFPYPPTTTANAAGSILVAGGALSSPASVFLPSDGNYYPKASLLTERSFHTATLLKDGRILVAGGASLYSQSCLTSAVLIDFTADLRMSSLTVPAAARTGDAIAVNGTVQADPAGDATRWVYVSLHLRNLNGTYTWLADRYVGGLRAGEIAAFAGTVNIPAGMPHGEYVITALADSYNVIAEPDENDNMRESSLIEVAGSDIVMNAADPLQGAAIRGETITIRSTVAMNQQYGAASWFYVSLYLRHPDGSESWLKDRYVSSLLPGIELSTDTTATLSATLQKGSYRIVARADGYGRIQEEDETNNVAISAALDVTGLQPEYDSAGDDATIPLRDFTFTENLVCNQHKHVVLAGGYDLQYATRPGNSRIKGTVTIAEGSVIFDRIEVY